MSTPDKNDFHLDLTFTGRSNNLLRPIAIAVAAIGILIIFASMATNVAARLLPMNDEYLQILIPRAPDGKEALALKTLEHGITDNTLNVSGSVSNRTTFPLTGITAVVEAQDLQARILKTIEIPVTPADLASQDTGTFQLNVTLDEKPAGYSLKFKLVNGPFVPHLDDRAALGAPMPAPTAEPAPPPPAPKKQ